MAKKQFWYSTHQNCEQQKQIKEEYIIIPVEKTLKGVRFIDLFAGIGGFHLALSSFGAKCVFASEWDKSAAKVYKNNFGIVPTGDITKIKASDIPDHDILCAGFPCQAFSISGKQRGFEDSRGTLFFDVARIIKEKQPKLVFLENVKNLVRHDNGRTFNVIHNTLCELGYTVFYKVINAADYNLPQHRERIFILAFRNDLGITEYNFPAKEGCITHFEDILESPEEVKGYEIHRDDVKLYHSDESFSSKPVRIGTVNKGCQGERIYSIKGVAITLSANGGGVGAHTGLYKVGDVIRRLSPRECARVQGFPDTFIISDNKNDAYKQFGNSVPVDVLQKILLNCPNKIFY